MAPISVLTQRVLCHFRASVSPVSYGVASHRCRTALRSHGALIAWHSDKLQRHDVTRFNWSGGPRIETADSVTARIDGMPAELVIPGVTRHAPPRR